MKIRSYKILYYDRTDINEGTDPTKSNRSKECMICHHWIFYSCVQISRLYMQWLPSFDNFRS